ncbi:MAG: hypothetical protein LBJ41_07345 [Treponema sp.]|jgi:hypothetical protein|nr:hypothetical protein [Treponema sp.]
MKKLIFGGFIGLLLCCTAVAFADPVVTGTFSGNLGEVVLDKSADGVLGHFDIEVEVPKLRNRQSLGAQEPAIREAIKKEIAKLGGTRAIDIMIQGYETADTVFARVIGTVVK